MAIPTLPAEPMPDPMAATPSMGAPSEVCIPLESLAVDGEDLKTVSPAVGDPVDFAATGTVTRVEGGNAYVTLESVNGEPLPAPEAAPEEMGESGLRGMAETQDLENY